MSDLVEFLRSRIEEDEQEAPYEAPRMHAEVKVKRAILNDYEALVGFRDPFAFAGKREGLVALEQVIRHIATVYASYPGYREEWRP